MSLWSTSEGPQRQQQQASEPTGDHWAAARPHGTGKTDSLCTLQFQKSMVNISLGLQKLCIRWYFSATFLELDIFSR